MKSRPARVVLWFFFSSRRRHTRCGRDWSSDVCSSDLIGDAELFGPLQFLDSVDLHGGGSGHLPGAKRPADTACWFQHPPPALAGSTNPVQSDSLLIVWLQIRSTSKTNVHFSISKSSKNMWQAYNWQAPKSNPFAWARPVWSMLIAFFCATNCG